MQKSTLDDLETLLRGLHAERAELLEGIDAQIEAVSLVFDMINEQISHPADKDIPPPKAEPEEAEPEPEDEPEITERAQTPREMLLDKSKPIREQIKDTLREFGYPMTTREMSHRLFGTHVCSQDMDVSMANMAKRGALVRKQQIPVQRAETAGQRSDRPCWHYELPDNKPANGTAEDTPPPANPNLLDAKIFAETLAKRRSLPIGDAEKVVETERRLPTGSLAAIRPG